MNWALILSIVVSIAGGWTMLSYRFFAGPSGYPMSELFTKNWPIYLGGITAFGAAFGAFSMLGFLWGLALSIAGLALSFAVLVATKSMAQPLSFTMVIVGYVLLWFTR